jgi:hypothetical protein
LEHGFFAVVNRDTDETENVVDTPDSAETVKEQMQVEEQWFKNRFGKYPEWPQVQERSGLPNLLAAINRLLGDTVQQKWLPDSVKSVCKAGRESYDKLLALGNPMCEKPDAITGGRTGRSTVCLGLPEVAEAFYSCYERNLKSLDFRKQLENGVASAMRGKAVGCDSCAPSTTLKSTRSNSEARAKAFDNAKTHAVLRTAAHRIIHRCTTDATTTLLGRFPKLPFRMVQTADATNEEAGDLEADWKQHTLPELYASEPGSVNGNTNRADKWARVAFENYMGAVFFPSFPSSEAKLLDSLTTCWERYWRVRESVGEKAHARWVVYELVVYT